MQNCGVKHHLFRLSPVQYYLPVTESLLSLTNKVFVSALFLLREENFLDEVPDEHKKVFVDENALAPAKLKVLKKMITSRFPVSVLSILQCDLCLMYASLNGVHYVR